MFSDVRVVKIIRNRSNELTANLKNAVNKMNRLSISNIEILLEDTKKKLTVEEVLRMDDGPEKRALEAKFTLAEKMEASKLRYKVEREKWKAMRNRGFRLDDALSGGKNGQM